MRSRWAACFVIGFSASVAGAQEGSLGTGASYSSNRGALAFLSFEGNDLPGGVDVNARIEAGDDGHGGTLGASKRFALGDTKFGRDSFIGLGLDGAVFDWDSQDFAITDVQATLRFGAKLSETTSYTSRLFWSRNELDRVGSTASPLIEAEIGKSSAVGLGVSLLTSTQDRRNLPTDGYRFSTDLAVATPAGDREWASFSIGAGYARSFGGVTLELEASAGAIEGLGGQDVMTIDRAFIGNPPRGFAFRGLGPRDVDAASGVDSPLGGNRFLISSAELRFKTKWDRLSLGTFVDAGSLWGLDSTTGAASEIDDSFSLRASAGVALYWETQIGMLEVSLSDPIEYEPTDEEENFAFGLRVSF